jgi:hypothetical protein
MAHYTGGAVLPNFTPICRPFTSESRIRRLVALPAHSRYASAYPSGRIPTECGPGGGAGPGVATPGEQQCTPDKDQSCHWEEKSLRYLGRDRRHDRVAQDGALLAGDAAPDTDLLAARTPTRDREAERIGPPARCRLVLAAEGGRDL